MKAHFLKLIPCAKPGTIYVDCSKLSDERLPVLKGKMKDWFDEACWHAPSLIVLDNLDRLIGAEVEVSHIVCSCLFERSDQGINF